MLWLVVALAVAQVEAANPSGERAGRGSASARAVSEADLAAVTSRRALSRTRASISAIGGGILFSGAAMPGFGLEGDLGVIFDDRLSLSAVVTLFTNVGGWEFGIGPGLDYVLSEHFALGGGVSLKLLGGLDSASVVSVMVPMRVTWSPMTRKPTEVARTGLLLGLQLAAGVVVVAGRGRGGGGLPVPSHELSGLLTIGYAAW